jgi:hypothetical protein
MSFDQNALDSLRIERAPEPTSKGSNPVYRWFLVAVLAIAAIAGAYALLRDSAIEVETATAVGAPAPRGRGGAGLYAAG